MKAFLNWSGGKDSAFCLYEAGRQGSRPEALVTTISQATGRISMHGVPSSLLHLQAASVQLPLRTIALPEGTGMQSYEESIHRSNRELIAEGFDTVLSGDLFLEDLKAYREQLYSKDGLQTAFPLWKKDTAELLRSFIGLGFKAIIVCTNDAYLDRSFCGRLIDESFLNDLPSHVDPCGEHGEYHSFVFDGPVFSAPVRFHKGELVYRTYPSPVAGDDCFTATPPPSGFYFCDLVPA